jgi:NAD dependent epimerase/dehydratase
MKIFITGSDGFIGSHLVEKLIKKGHKVRALVQYNSFGSIGHLEYLDKNYKDKLEIEHGDIRDVEFLNKSIVGSDIVLHLAALIAIPYSYDAIESYIDTNIKGTLNVIKASLRNNIKHIVSTSTSEVYGSAQYIPIDENHRLIGQSPYSASKIGADQLAMSFYYSFKAPITILRPFNTYGPRQSLRAVIPSVIIQCLKNKSKINLGDVTTTRDFNYVDDITKAFLKVINNKKSIGKVINIGSNYEISIKDLAKLIIQLTKSNSKLSFDKKRIRPKLSEVRRLKANASVAKKIIKWSPMIGGKKGLIDGLKKTIDWYSKNYDFKNKKETYLK